MRKVMIFGTFDILHYGHLDLFRQAKSKGDKLIAVIARDKNVKRIKGAKAYHSEEERKNFLKHIDFIDEVILGDIKNVYKVIKKHKPDKIVLGYDQKKYVDKLEEELKKTGLETKIIRAKPYKSSIYKTSKIKDYLNKYV